MAKETVTIYIDDSAIRLLIAKGRSVQSWGDMPLEPGLVRDGVILDQDAVAAKVKELWQTAGRKRKVGKPGKVIAGISGINCLHRLLTLPELPKDLLPEAVKREAGRVLGVPLAELYLFWQVLPSMRGEILIYLVALPRNTVDSLVSTLRRAGFNPYLMDLKPLAIARTITALKAIIVDVQPCSLDIVIMVDRIPQVVRSIPLPREASLEDRVPVIKEELSRAILFYNSSHLDKPIEADVPLLVSGELAEREDMWSFLLDERKRPVQVLPSPMEAAEGFPHSQYLTNIGLALKEVPAAEKEVILYSLVDFNALPEIYLPRRRPLSEIIYIAVIIIGIALIAWLAVSNIVSSRRMGDLRSELAGINLNIAAINQKIIDLNREISGLEGWISLVEEHHNSLNQKIGKLNDDIVILGAKLDIIDENGSSIRQEMDSLNTDMSKLNHDVQELMVNMSAVGAVRDDIVAINEGIVLEQQEVDQLSQDIESLEGCVSTIEGDLADINQVITDLNQHIAELGQQVPLLQYDITSINQEIDRLNQDTEGMRDRITSIQTDIDSINIALNVIDTAIGFAHTRGEVNGDLDAIINFKNHGMPAGLVNLTTISHDISGVTVTGSAAHEDDIFRYADYLRASEREDGSRRFALVVVTKITGAEGALSFTLELIK